MDSSSILVVCAIAIVSPIFEFHDVLREGCRGEMYIKAGIMGRGRLYTPALFSSSSSNVSIVLYLVESAWKVNWY